MESNYHHTLHYLTLIAGLIVFFGLFVYFRYSPEKLMLLGVGASGFYSLWGIVHHAIEHRLNKLILIEYISVSVLVVSLVLVVLNI